MLVFSYEFYKSFKNALFPGQLQTLASALPNYYQSHPKDPTNFRSIFITDIFIRLELPGDNRNDHSRNNFPASPYFDKIQDHRDKPCN